MTQKFQAPPNPLNQPRINGQLHRMNHHHPDSQWLTEYVAGTLSDSQALCVSTHLSYCSDCGAEVAELGAVGSVVFENQPPSAPVDQKLFAQIMQKIEGREMQSQDQSEPVHSPLVTMPPAIRKLMPDGMDNLPWKKLGKRIRIATLDRLDEEREVALHKLMPGGAVANHDHHGQEITVVLCGSFSDQDGVYRAGDFIVRDTGDTHRPTVNNDEECICLSVSDAPVKFTGVLARLLNPLVAYQHKH